MGKYDLTGVREVSQTEEAQPAVAMQPTRGAVISPSAAAGREPGKRSNPEYSRTTVYMRDSTKLKATRLLQDRKDDRDLSDLIESLVAEWTSKHTSV